MNSFLSYLRLFIFLSAAIITSCSYARTPGYKAIIDFVTSYENLGSITKMPLETSIKRDVYERLNLGNSKYSSQTYNLLSSGSKSSKKYKHIFKNKFTQTYYLGKETDSKGGNDFIYVTVAEDKTLPLLFTVVREFCEWGDCQEYGVVEFFFARYLYNPITKKFND